MLIVIGTFMHMYRVRYQIDLNAVYCSLVYYGIVVATQQLCLLSLASYRVRLAWTTLGCHKTVRNRVRKHGLTGR